MGVMGAVWRNEQAAGEAWLVVAASAQQHCGHQCAEVHDGAEEAGEARGATRSKRGA